MLSENQIPWLANSEMGIQINKVISGKIRDLSQGLYIE